MGGVPSGGSLWKNVLIGIGTTVAAYAIVNVLFKSKGPSASSERKRVTSEAWQSVNKYNKLATEKFRTLACMSCDQQAMKTEMLRELSNNNKSLEGILDDKNLDDGMKTIINRTRDKFTDLRSLYETYFDSIIYINTLPKEEQLALSPGIHERMLDKRKHIERRDNDDVLKLLEDINKKYKLELAQTKEELLYEKKALINKWTFGCGLTIEFKNDNTLQWKNTDGELTGTWTIDDTDPNNRKLDFKLSNGDEFKTVVIELNACYIAIYSEADGMPFEGCSGCSEGK
ncbi:MAG TPA: hypothetical protein VHM26_14205 [Chitinophagaceae bacterium]|jgi:hypothetical protein|nr:hypothetical protein [Chitinophagaceae bacterium]